MATILKLFAGALLVAIGASALNASAASVSTPNTAVTLAVEPVDVNNMKPASCAGIVLTAVVGGSGTVTGTAANELITGSSGADVLDGLDGDDCLVGGAGVDDLRGGQGTDVCDSGAGTDTFVGCETEIQ